MICWKPINISAVGSKIQQGDASSTQHFSVQELNVIFEVEYAEILLQKNMCPILQPDLLLVMALVWGPPSWRCRLAQSDAYLFGRLSYDLQQTPMSGKLSSLDHRHLTPIFSYCGVKALMPRWPRYLRVSCYHIKISCASCTTHVQA